MARWPTSVAFVAVATLFLASAGSAEPLTAHSSSDDVLAGVFVGSVAEGQIGDGAGSGDYELGIGQAVGAPLRSENFEWASGTTYDWTLTFVPGSFGGTVEFTFNGVSVQMGTAIPFNSFFIRTFAQRPGTSVAVTNLRIGGPPGGGGGSNTIFETANPLEEAKSSASGSSGVLDILKISNVDLVSGFTLTGKAKLVFASANPQPQGAEASFQIFVAVTDPNDSDGDGVPDIEDNCPNRANSSQANNDGDSLGDACDNCPFVTNPPGPNGKQPNEDGDKFGDACDNCPLTALPPFPFPCKPVGGGTCKIDDGTNSDTDLWGDRCDNCPFIDNDDQADRNGNGKGDLCDDNKLVWDTLPGAAPFAAGASFATSTATVASVPVTAAAGTTTTVELSIDCSTDVASANIGINLTNTSTTFLDFSNCTTPGGPNPTERTCANANVAELGDTISLASSVIGPGITSAGDPPVAGSPPADMVILQLRGRAAADGGRPDDLICAAGTDDVPLGVLRLQDFIVGSNPLSNAGFGTFTPPLTQLVGPTGPVPDQQVVFQVNPPGTPLIAVQLRPAATNGDRIYELSIIVDPAVGAQKVSRLAFGLTSSEPVTPADMIFGGCNNQEGNPPGTPAGLLGTLRGCPVVPEPTKLGGDVATPSLLVPGTDGAPVIATYTVGPEDAESLAESNRLPDTLYVALDSAFESGSDPGVNGVGDSQFIGTVEFPSAADPPQITFQGTEELPGYGAGPVVSAVAGQVTASNVTLINTFSTSDDSDSDGEPDDLDNCVRVPNGGPGGQANTGGVGFVAGASDFDNIGDACQCADPGRDGVADNGSAVGAPEGFDPQNDVVKCQKALSGQALPPGEDSNFCKVTPTEGSFSIIDVLVLEADTAVPGSSGLGDPKTGSLQSCGAAEGQL